MVWLERSKRTTQTKLCPRNIEDEALLFASIKACGSEVAYDPECCFDRGSLIRDKVYIHFKDASSKCSVRADQAEAPKDSWPSTFRRPLWSLELETYR